MRNDTITSLRTKRKQVPRGRYLINALKGFILIPLLSPKELREHVPIQPKRINVLTEYVIRVNHHAQIYAK